MKFFDKAKLGAERALSIITTQTKLHAPQLEFGFGMGLVTIGGCLLFIEGRRSKEKDFKAIYNKQVEEIDKGFAPKSLKNKAKRKAALKYIGSEAANVAPGALSTVGGLLFMQHGFDRLALSKRALEAALAASVASSQKMAQALTDKVGFEKAEDVFTGARTEDVVVGQAVNPDGTVHEVLHDSVTVYNVNDIFDLPGESFIYSRETCCGLSFQDDDDHFAHLCDCATRAANRKLQNTQGYVFTEDIVSYFSVEPKPLHKVCGYVMPDPKRPREGDEKRLCGVKFTTKKIQIEYDDGSRTNGWLITPIDDGSIIDIYGKYSLQRLLVDHRIKERNYE